MSVNTLTEQICRTSVNNDGKLRKLSDGYGMYLAILPSGNKVWRMAYKFEGREKTAVIGPYPLISLKDARIRRDALRLKRVDGIDLTAKIDPKKTVTFVEAIEFFLATKRNNQQKSLDGDRSLFRLWVTPIIGHKDIATVTRQDIVQIYDQLGDVGKLPSLKKVKTVISGVLQWGIAKGYCEIDFTKMIQESKAYGTIVSKSFPHVPLSGVKDLMNAINAEPATTVQLACKLFALTWLRSAELRHATWDMVIGDKLYLPAKLPNGQNHRKYGKEHVIPLSKQALVILEELKKRSRTSNYIMANERSSTKELSENSVLSFLYRIGYKGKQSGHGFRSIGSTWANEMGYNSDHIENQLSHTNNKDKDKTRQAYNKAEYMKHRVKLMQDFADWLDNPDTSFMEST
jgi:integrase